MGEEGEHADHRGQRKPDPHPLEDRPGPVAEPHVLEEEDHLEALAIDRGHPEQDQADHRRPRAVDPGSVEDPPALAVAVGDPAAPVDLVEEPVHHHQQHDHRQQPGRRLHGEAAAAELAQHPGGEEPGDDGGREAGAGADRDRLPVGRAGADHAGGHRGQDEDRLQPLAEDQQPAVEDDGAVAEVGGGGRVGGAAGGGERAPEDQQGHRAQQVERPAPLDRVPQSSHLRLG